MHSFVKSIKILEFLTISSCSLVQSQYHVHRRNGQQAALLIIDVQNCFITGGLALKNSPANQDGFDVIAPINALLTQHRRNDLFSLVVYSLDWHPQNHVSFFSNVQERPIKQNIGAVGPFDTVTFMGPPPFNQTLWPDHCIQNTSDSNLHADLDEVPGSIRIYKGTNPEVDSYSAFFDNYPGNDSSGLDRILAEYEIEVVYVAGLATDYCVGFTALDSLRKLHLPTVVISDASRGVADDTIANKLEEIKRAGGILVSAHQVPDLITGKMKWPRTH